MKELQLIQTALKAPKGQFNAFGKYKYRSCEDILEAAKPLLAANKCTLTITDEIVCVSERVYVKATATLTNSDGAAVSTTAFAREAKQKTGMDEAQVTGAASSYARKYALNGLFCIDDTKDADSLNTSKEYTQQPALSNEAVAEAINDLICCSTDRQSFEEAMRRHQEFMTNDRFRAACAEISKKYPKK